MIGYEDTIAALDGLYHLPFQPSGIVGLRRAFAMLAELGNPHLAFRSVHVAGSSGKGSTSAMIASILRHAGYRTGFFQSPHLLDYTERISLGGMEISRDEWTCCFDLVWPVVQAMMEGRVGEPELGRPTLFEVLFAMAAIHFRDKGAEWAVLEAGLGGRLDATNTVQADVAVVTNVSLEHTRVLGSTVREIAVEKAAIIKSGVHAVTAATGEALEVIEDRAASVRAPLLVVPRDVSARIVDESLLETRLELVSGALSLPVRLPMPGAFQATNAATAAAVVRSLRARGVDIPSSAIECGLGQTSFGGRLEVVQLEPLIVIDGAHHPDAIRVLMESLRRLVHGRGTVLLFAAQADKDADRMARMLGPGIETVIVTRVPGSERSASAAKLAQALEEVAGEVIAVEGYVEALKLARSRLSRNCMLLVTGSLYLAGAVRQLLRPKA